MKISVIGTGYVGLVTGTCFAEMGNDVICVDNNPEKLEKLKKGIVPIYEPGLELLFNRNISHGRITFSEDLKHAVTNSEIIFLCLPTPMGEDGSADLSYVMNVSKEIAEMLIENNSYKIIVNKSTVPVGTGQKVINIVNKAGAKNVEVASNPEFLREGFAVDDFLKPDRIVIGANSDKALDKLKLLYAPFVRQGNPILTMDIPSAEVTKYAANSYLAMRITFMNELANFCEISGADVDEVRKGISTDSRIGKRFLFPGIGYGGSCFPKDVKAFVKTSQEINSELSILNLVDKVNEKQKTIIVDKILNHFNNDIKGKTFTIWGLAFKPNTDDMRSAPSINIINLLLEKGAKVNAFDPAALENSKFYFGDKINYCEDAYVALKDADALIICTEWNEFRNPDFEEIKSLLKNPLIFDGRNLYLLSEMENLGFTYYSIGRRKVAKN